MGNSSRSMSKVRGLLIPGRVRPEIFRSVGCFLAREEDTGKRSFFNTYPRVCLVILEHYVVPGTERFYQVVLQ